MNLEERVIDLRPQDLSFPFDGKPSFVLSPYGAGDYDSLYIGDTFPCYTHDRELVIETARHCERRFPIGFKPTYYIVPFEDSSRTNGCAFQNNVWDKPQNKEAHAFAPYIILWGKRIPPHPAMTRYLTSHEYGHCVDYWIQYKKGVSDDSKTDRAYAEMRGIECDRGYGGGRWHSNIGEIIANDIRVSVFGVEKEFWPHDCLHPDSVPAVGNFWYEMMLNYGNEYL